MAVINKIKKEVQLDKKDIIEFQLLTHSFLRKEANHLNKSELACLSLLSLCGSEELSRFCLLVKQHNIYASEQSARNALTKLERKSYISCKGKRHRIVELHPDIQLQVKGNILLDYQFAHIEQ